MNSKQIVTKIHLVISIAVVVPAAIIYGFYPNMFLEIENNSTDMGSLLKAIMVVYLTFALLWSLGLFKKSILKTALYSNTAFMLGLGIGRCVSMLTDGIPSDIFLFGTIGELLLGFYGLWVILKWSTNINPTSSYIKNQ